MCFVLYMASNTFIPDIPFDTNAPALNTQPLSERESPVRRVFEQTNVKFLGSTNHCGCGYRHLSFQNGGWPEEYLIAIDPEFGADMQDDHENLHRFLLDQLQHADRIELFGCWDGDFDFPPERHETIGVDDVIRRDFFLRERCHYTVIRQTVPENAG